MHNTLENLHKRFDHAALQPEMDERRIVRSCREAVEHQFYAVAVNPVWVAVVRRELQGSPVKVLSVAGFPLGANRTDIKIVEAIKGVLDGAHEIDMVANIGWLTSDCFLKAEEEISEVRKNLSDEVTLKVIIEAGKLTPERQVEATKAAINAGAQFVKTSTGFLGGATVDQVRNLHRAAEGRIGVKAAGGIRTLRQCRELIEAGATRLGSSASVHIIQELTNKP
jgi:deoxyribose-phosphate aldolase